MSLTSGARLGAYEIVALIGAGGMGEVYRARDTRLDRTVAIKILPEALAADAQFRERFDREARTVSQLEHPNICTLYDVGHENGVHFLVMQHLEGETLAERLTKGALPVEQTLKVAIEVAEALDKAHRAGVVHRDLKPGNIMLTKTGAKLLDFGLAKTGVPVVTSLGLSILPTTPHGNAVPGAPELTAQGTILGTFQYMAPEQLEGQDADARTDIFAFGAVVYEMLTGRKAFTGKSHATLIAAIVSSDPPSVSGVQPLTPPPLERVIRKCLAKDPDERWQSARDLSDELKWAATGSSASAVAPVPTIPARRARRLTWGLGGLAAVSTVVAVALAIAAFQGWLAPKVPPAAKIAFTISTETGPSPLQISLSPDGTRLQTIVTTPEGGTGIWLRRLNDVGGQILPDTNAANFPFWSPDSRFLAFFAAGKLHKVDVFGGPPQVLCDAVVGRGGTWNRDGVILFAPMTDGPLFKVSSAGGDPVQATELDRTRGDIAHRHPKFLPDGRHFLFFAATGDRAKNGVYVGALDSKATSRVVATEAMGLFAPPDHLLFMRDTTLMTQRFDPQSFTLLGNPIPVAQDVGVNVGNSVAGVGVSETGVLAYRVGGNLNNRLLRLVDRTGKPLRDVLTEGSHENARFAPGGDRLVETKFLDSFAAGDIWIVDLARDSSTRFTFDAALDDDAVWSPDGSQIVFVSTRDGGRNLYLKSTGGASEETLLLKTDASKYPTDWSRDGRYLLYTQTTNANDVWILPLTGEKKPMPFLQTRFDENRARFSPDGRWIAYTSYESGRAEVYVQSFPVSGGKWQISTSGGVEPHWRGDGRELYYLSMGAMLAVDLNGSDPKAFKAGVPRKLFDTLIPTNQLRTSFDVTSDGQRFLLNVNATSSATTVPPIHVAVNWTTGLEP